jgi:hypothetical protein
MAEAITALIAEKRATGYKYDAEERVLTRFTTFCADGFPDQQAPTRAAVEAWLEAARGRGVTPATLQSLAAPVRELARWFGRRRVSAYVLPAGTVPRPARYVPHMGCHQVGLVTRHVMVVKNRTNDAQPPSQHARSQSRQMGRLLPVDAAQPEQVRSLCGRQRFVLVQSELDAQCLDRTVSGVAVDHLWRVAEQPPALAVEGVRRMCEVWVVLEGHEVATEPAERVSPGGQRGVLVPDYQQIEVEALEGSEGVLATANVLQANR